MRWGTRSTSRTDHRNLWTGIERQDHGGFTTPWHRAKLGGIAAFIDAEHALDPSWARRVGVDLESLLISQPSSAEEALKIAEMLIKSNAVDMIVIDSVAALVPRSEVEGEIGDQHVGLQARLMSQALRILNPAISAPGRA